MGNRKLFIDNRIGTVDQGTIFNGGLAEGYDNCVVFGIIITPRCDIANEKVNTYHYLPIVDFNDWFKRDFWILYRSILIKNIKGTLKQIFNQNDLSSSLIDYFSPNELIGKSVSTIAKVKQKDKAERLLLDLDKIMLSGSIPVSTEVLKYFTTNYDGIVKSILKELSRYQRNAFYLLEDWNKSNYYKIVLMRDIRRIPVQVGDKIGTGFYSSELKDEEKKNNELNLELDIIYGEKRLVSPFVEHLIQVFFQNFGRIGVEDHDSGIDQVLIEQIIL